MKWFALLMLVCVIDIPLAVWANLSAKQRAKVEMQAIQNHCRADIKNGRTIWQIERKFEGWNYQLHIIPVDERI